MYAKVAALGALTLAWTAVSSAAPPIAPRHDERVWLQAQSSDSLPAAGDERRDRFDFRLPPPPPDGEWPDQEGSWLGVQLAPVPPPLGAHLGTGEDGLMVRNLFRNSPADGADIDRYDVIIEADGKRVSGDVARFADHVRHKKAGDELSLLLFHEGKQKSVTVKVTEAPRGRPELKFPEEFPDVWLQRNLGLRGRILRPGPQGNWIWEDLENLPDIRDLLKEHMRDRQERRSGGWAWGGRGGPASRPADADVARRVDNSGGVLQVRRLPDGSIEVRRMEQRGTESKVEMKTYRSVDELKKFDPEAVDLLNTLPPPERRGNGGSRGKALPAPAPGDVRGPGGPQPPVPPPQEAWPPQPPKVPASPLAPPVKAPKTQPADGVRPPMPPRPAVGMPPPPREPAVSFDVQLDGSITVHSRQGDAELSTTFKSREVFKQRAPELFKRFEAMEQTLR